MVQSMDDASPAKWHLAHTTWFFERFVLGARAGYVPVDAHWDLPVQQLLPTRRPDACAAAARAAVTRPSLAQVLDYRAEVDARMARRFEAGDLDDEARAGAAARHPPRAAAPGTAADRHQARVLVQSAGTGVSRRPADDAAASAAPLRWIARDESIAEIGAPPWPQAPQFAYDNESPRHRVLVPAHALANRPVSNGEYAGLRRRWRLRQRRPLAQRWLGAAAGGRLAAAAVLARATASREFTLARLARTRSACAGLPSELLRSRRVRALGRRAPADRGRMGAGRRPAWRSTGNFVDERRPASAGRGERRHRPAAAVRRRLGMDVRRLHPVSRIQAAARHRSANTTASS